MYKKNTYFVHTYLNILRTHTCLHGVFYGHCAQPFIPVHKQCSGFTHTCSAFAGPSDGRASTLARLSCCSGQKLPLQIRSSALLLERCSESHLFRNSMEEAGLCMRSTPLNMGRRVAISGRYYHRPTGAGNVIDAPRDLVKTRRLRYAPLCHSPLPQKSRHLLGVVAVSSCLPTPHLPLCRCRQLRFFLSPARFHPRPSRVSNPLAK